MGCIQDCAFCHRNRQLIITLMFLLLSSLSKARFMVEGRAVSKLVHSASLLNYSPKEREEEEEVVVGRRLIGSRPPRCERRSCGSCGGHCEAIQVPIVPQHRSSQIASARSSSSSSSNFRLSATPLIMAFSRGDDISNYKPICWKCKCGDFIFNP